MSKHTMHRFLAVSALTAAFLIPTVGRAQSASLVATDVVATNATAVVTPAATASTASTDGPRMTQSGVARVNAPTSMVPPQQFRSDRRDVAWMVVGGAALVVGSMVGGDAGTIIMITGGVIGLMGLFRYMQ